MVSGEFVVGAVALLPGRLAVRKLQILGFLLVVASGCGLGRASPAPAPTGAVEGPCVSTPAVYLIDGVRVDSEAFNALEPSEIATINIFQNAVARFGPDASCGAIVVTTQ